MSDRFRPVSPSHGRVTLALTFGFVLAYRAEQNVAYVLGISPRQLVTLDTFPANALTQVFAPLLHASGDHLVATLVWVVPFGYFLERRRPWQDYVGFVVVAGFLTTTLVPALFVVGGVAPGLGIGGSGVAHALVGREATARLRSLHRWRSLPRVEWGIAAVATVGLGVTLLGLADPPAGTSVVGHATGLVVGVVAGVGERYVSATPDRSAG
ncbi:rhomboid family intramembrane serine protease [Haloplanus rallus]|uniref:Rhomboid family intramembrane serine protease n=1 Tax=Haloplanus rallus TaxID=1816183 RepID=A0A6B9F3J8_9EURY|nr:rhomboid family intramembrane serine protease [Haloplanus rallus]